MTETSNIVAGADFGSDSVRVLLLDTSTGETVATSASAYRRWAAERYSDPAQNQFRQHPLDYLEALTDCFQQLQEPIKQYGLAALAIDTTGSTLAPVDKSGTPLALLPEFRDDPDAMFWMWKDRTSSAEADLINRVLPQREPDFTSYQGKYSSEWWWAKILRASRINPDVRRAATSWLEHSDWLPNILVGSADVTQFKRNSCASGHKALHNRALGGGVPGDILADIDPYLAQIQETIIDPPVPAGTPLGQISEEWARRLGVPASTLVGMGSLDAHAGAVAAGVSHDRLVKVVGTSTVDMFLVDEELPKTQDTYELCGLAEDSIIPGHLGAEAGQAAFGDLFSWFAELTSSFFSQLILEENAAGGEDEAGTRAAVKRASKRMLAALDKAASERSPSGVTAQDWLNGRRYPYPDEQATASLTNLRIGDDIVDVYKALTESAVLGSKYIYSELQKVGINLSEIVLVGGIANKSPYISQLMSDALGAPIMVLDEPEVCAKGAAMYAAVAAGKFDSLEEAQGALLTAFRADYSPRPEEVARLNEAFEVYKGTSQPSNLQGRS